MILRMCQISRITGIGIEELRAGSPWTSGINYISKRYAGHSQYANRKHIKEANNQKRGLLIRKYNFEISKLVQRTKDANLSTNSKLQALFGEAMKNNIPKVTLENALKVAAATLNHDSINEFVYVGPFGIIALIEISSLNREHAKSQVTSVMKKFGFRASHNAEINITSVGIITCKLPENTQTSLDKAVEDAILAECEEVKKKDDKDDNYIEFQCDLKQMDTCAKKLEDLKYQVDHSEIRRIFPEFVKIDEAIIERLDKMEEKLQLLPGYVRVSYNFE